MNIYQVDRVDGTFRCGWLRPDLSPAAITARLGFPPVANAHEWKVTMEWYCRVDGKLVGVWDFRGTRWSFYGPRNTMLLLFPTHVVPATATDVPYHAPLRVERHRLPTVLGPEELLRNARGR